MAPPGGRYSEPTFVRPEDHAEWGLYKILEHMGLHEILPSGSGKNRAKLRRDIEGYHIAYAIDFDDADIDTFIARRPDGLGFDKEEKLCVFLEYMRAMDTTEDWAERKEQEKNDRYSSRCERCLLITESPKTPGHFRYLIWVLCYIPYTGLAVFSYAISRAPVYTAISIPCEFVFSTL